MQSSQHLSHLDRNMKKSTLYFFLLVLGAVLPLAFFLPFVATEGLDVLLFLKQLFANRISGFFAMDVLVSSGVTFAFTLFESRRLALRVGPWCLLGLLVGVSLALPLFLWIRERHLEASRLC